MLTRPGDDLPPPKKKKTDGACENPPLKIQPGLSTKCVVLQDLLLICYEQCDSTATRWNSFCSWNRIKIVTCLKDCFWTLHTFFLPNCPSWMTCVANTGCWTDGRSDRQPCHLLQLVIVEQPIPRLLFAAQSISHNKATRSSNIERLFVKKSIKRKKPQAVTYWQCAALLWCPCIETHTWHNGLKWLLKMNNG